MMNGPRPGGGSHAFRPSPKPGNFFKATKRLLSYSKQWNFIMAIAVLMTIVAVFLETVTPKILGQATTEIYKGVKLGLAQMKAGASVKEFPIDFSSIIKIVVFVIVLYSLSGFFNLIQQVIMTRVSQRIVYQMRKDLKEKITRVPVSYYDQHSKGDLLSRVVNDMDNINTMLQSGLAQLITSVVTLVGVFIMMMSISWKLTLIALLTIPMSGLVIGIIAPNSQRFFRAQQNELGDLNGHIEESVSGHSVIKSYNREDQAIADFEEKNERYFKASWKAQFVSSFLFPMMNLIKNLDYVFVAVIGGIEVMQGKITLGNVQAFLQYTGMISRPIGRLANLINTIQSTIASAERVFAVLDAPEMDLKPQNHPVDNSSQAKVDFKNVAFSYEPDQELIQDFNLAVKPGDQIAIVGQTGAGKTTIINLLERFYEVNSGAILMDGKDIRNFTYPNLRSKTAMVLQDSWLFNGTIYDNIRYAKQDATQDEVCEAAKNAHADLFIRELPDGYQTVLNENATNISLGQRQLLTIARVFLANPEIIILDEATSSVDTRTEKLIQEAMAKLADGRTTFTVAHRLSTIKNADKIVVMDKGKIVEIGNHDELMAKQGVYANLYNYQFVGSQALKTN